jgi:hypothetical protein
MVSLKPAEKLALLMAIFVVLNTVDWAMTMYGLSNGAAEGNPLVRNNLNNLALASAIKLVAIPLLFVLTNSAVFGVSKKRKLALVIKISLGIVVVVNIIYLGVIVNNLLVLHFFT